MGQPEFDLQARRFHALSAQATVITFANELRAALVDKGMIKGGAWGTARSTASRRASRRACARAPPGVTVRPFGQTGYVLPRCADTLRNEPLGLR